MIKKGTIFFGICFILFAFSACYYDKADQVYPMSQTPVACDTTNVKYSVQIANIINDKCISCHGGDASLGGGWQLLDYTAIQYLMESGQLISAITHDGRVPPMPQGLPKLSDCEINTFLAWYNSGYQDN